MGDPVTYTWLIWIIKIYLSVVFFNAFKNNSGHRKSHDIHGLWRANETLDGTEVF